MKKMTTGFVTLLLMTILSQAQTTDFNGTWNNPDLEMISGIQYSNAVPKHLEVAQTKDSITLVRTSAGNDGDITFSETLPLNGKTLIHVTKTSKRTIRSSATWSNSGRTLTLLTTYSYADKPAEIEFTNTELWELSPDGKLVITKTSDAAVTDDWTIKAVFQKQ